LHTVRGSEIMQRGGEDSNRRRTATDVKQLARASAKTRKSGKEEKGQKP